MEVNGGGYLPSREAGEAVKILCLFLRDIRYGNMNLENYFQAVNQKIAATNVIILPEFQRAQN